MEPQAPSLTPMIRLLCSYGGRIMPFPPANSLQYIGGETRIVAVPRDISFTNFYELLSGKLLSGRSFSLKYRLPGCDLDSLITVDNNDDLQNMIAEYDSSSLRRIRLFLFPLNHSESTRCSVSVNRLLGLESPVQKTSFTSSSSVHPIPIFPPNNSPTKRVDHGKFDEENLIKDEAHKTTASLFSPENTAVDAIGGVSDTETEKAEVQDKSRTIVQEPLQQQQQRLMVPVLYYVPVWSMQPQMVTQPVNAYPLSPATEYSSGLDPLPGNKENGT
ncbi:hypothetical protein EUTSA_v10009340mg [Eutrema salsugineum]|uniref:PB1 domain-containing protein n=1 Tax=Eutrema salsugineum TaxID=72664 RepID=V4KSE2_EUTSA|nr:uncharacterized protein LOC18992395 [Eutrema salsugineum]ESQ34209.1 hypothetical protein EUTSA_v10009340mg [Eutrema salsugineum]